MSDFKWRHYRGEIILSCVRWYCKYGISYRGQKIHLLDQREATLVAGLEMAVQKFGLRLEVTGTVEQKKQIAMTAAKHGLRVEFTDQWMQQVYLGSSLQNRQRGGRDLGDFER